MVKLEARKVFLKGVFHGGGIALYEVLSCMLIMYLYLLVDSTAHLNSPVLVLLLFVNISMPFIYIGCKIKKNVQLTMASLLLRENQYYLFYPLGIAVWVTAWTFYRSDGGLYLVLLFPVGIMFHAMNVAIFLWMGSWFCRARL